MADKRRCRKVVGAFTLGWAVRVSKSKEAAAAAGVNPF